MYLVAKVKASLRGWKDVRGYRSMINKFWKKNLELKDTQVCMEIFHKTWREKGENIEL